MGLAARAGFLQIGAEDCAKELKRGKGRLLIAASDAAGNTLARAKAMAADGKAALLCTAYTKQDIAQAIGRNSPVALALICDGGLAKAFEAAATKMD